CLAGFGRFDGSCGQDLGDNLLDFCRAGDPPVASTLGTGMTHRSRFFQAAVTPCETLGVRGLLLTKYSDQLPKKLPSDVLHCGFAPFRRLLPPCAALVHHGGIGTTAAALETGTPQLILPLAWDQPDNAARLRRLGAGDWLGRRQRTGLHLARA